MNAQAQSLLGLRLIVEDEAFIAMDLEEMLHELRCEVVATASLSPLLWHTSDEGKLTAHCSILISMASLFFRWPRNSPHPQCRSFW